MAIDYDDEDSLEIDQPECETLRVVVPAGSELRLKFEDYFKLSREERNRIELEQPESFRNGRYGKIISGGTTGTEVELPFENLGTAILFFWDSKGHLLRSEQVFP
jgi:hypothetical protein